MYSAITILWKFSLSLAPGHNQLSVSHFNLSFCLSPLSFKHYYLLRKIVNYGFKACLWCLFSISSLHNANPFPKRLTLIFFFPFLSIVLSSPTLPFFPPIPTPAILFSLAPISTTVLVTFFFIFYD